MKNLKNAFDSSQETMLILYAYQLSPCTWAYYFSENMSVMEKFEKFQIAFNKPSPTYLAGETVYGYGWLVLKEAVYVQSKLP